MQLNKPYKISEIASQLFKVTPKTFSNNKQKYMKHLSQYYKYKEQKRKIILLEQLQPFETMSQNKIHDKADKQAVYKEQVHEILDVQKLNSGSNIARQISRNNNHFNHKQSTMLNYIRPVMREDYKMTERIWSKINIETLKYEPMTKEQVNDLMQIFKNAAIAISNVQLSLLQDLELKNITQEQYNKSAGILLKKKYNALLEVFRYKHGFTPVNVGWYELLTQEQKQKIKEGKSLDIVDGEFNPQEVFKNEKSDEIKE